METTLYIRQNLSHTHFRLLHSRLTSNFLTFSRKVTIIYMCIAGEPDISIWKSQVGILNHQTLRLPNCSRDLFNNLARIINSFSSKLFRQTRVRKQAIINFTLKELIHDWQLQLKTNQTNQSFKKKKNQ